ncbi:hypothetical protein GCM10010448_63550 [Streptomyces glomeratus]|uniref:Uncharacterized protein n=1 Tax=Streptomyces glomeratus TaxID=284452 RepID=A0ABP6M4C4_9ACTN
MPRTTAETAVQAALVRVVCFMPTSLADRARPSHPANIPVPTGVSPTSRRAPRHAGDRPRNRPARTADAATATATARQRHKPPGPLTVKEGARKHTAVTEVCSCCQGQARVRAGHNTPPPGQAARRGDDQGLAAAVESLVCAVGGDGEQPSAEAGT